MLPAYTTYALYNRNMESSLKRVANDPIISRDAKYYADNIGKVKSLDAFLKDHKLYSYAMKAHGLEEMTYATAFMKKVLESNLKDPNSFVNKLKDTRYRDFAAAFDFGTIKTEKTVQTKSQQDRLVTAYHDTDKQRNEEQKEETRYYNIVIDKVGQVDDIFKNTRLRNYIFKSFGIDPQTFDYKHLKGVLTSDISKADSYVNSTYKPLLEEWQAKIADLRDQRTKIPSTDKTSLEKNDYLINQYNKRINGAAKLFELAATFNFRADGLVNDGTKAQTAVQKRLTNENYVLANPRVTQTGAILNRDFFVQAMKDVTDAGQLTANSRLRTMLIVAFDLQDNSGTDQKIQWALRENPADPQSGLYSEKDKGFIDLAKAFNFGTDGKVAAGKAVQSDGQLSTMMNLYFSRYDDKQEAADEKTIKDYRRYIGLTKNLDDFLSAAPAAVAIRNFALKAFNIGTEESSTFKLKKVFTSDLSNPKSYVYTLKDDRFLRLAKAFNFDAQGKIGSPRFAQAENEIARISRNYLKEVTRWDKDKKIREKGEKEVGYYREKMGTLETADQLLADRRLLDFMLVAERIDPKSITTDYLKKIFKSDLKDPKSFANTEKDPRFRALAGSFNFDAKGNISATTHQPIQNNRSLMETRDKYVRQKLEERAGEENSGVRLALYFKRMAGGISSAYDILADKALSEVTRTALGIPAETANAKVDAQAKMIEKRLKIKDLQDPKKVEKLVNRFLMTFEANNSGSDPRIALFRQGSASISGNTLATLAQLRSGRRG
ncbi:Protein of unknown function [Agrobacterium fabrum]|uniref:DUF1217 domain-containing protein n=1 Tax=Agrobacterium fabrum TaxID=1176649 RepID=UPI000887B2C5|nr:DUF1217 domain-containing protein [Agrobacterium fabrum]MDH6295634.1 hypothetical protein [Agrobacterium fabrum]SDB49046.1 Protein of unknown function [Agrobacterium fabrum]SEQ95377.1 Protein of unknown function [Agrobacterium fabrum]